MAWTFRGSTSAVRGGSNPPANWTSLILPGNLAIGDLLVLQIQTFGVNASPPIPQNPTGWTQVALITNGGTSNHRHYFGYRQYTSTTVNPVLTFTGTGTTGNNGDSYTTRVMAFRPGAGFTWEIDVTGTASTNASANSIGPATGITPTTLSGGASSLVVGSFGKPNDFLSVGTAPTDYTGLLTETTTGSDASCYFIRRLDAPQTATGNLTVTDTGQAGVGASILTSFKEVAVAPVGGARSFAVIC
jgi:hypothetical protein